MLFLPLINVKMPTIVGILTFMSRKNFMLSWVEHEKSFITSGPGRRYTPSSSVIKYCSSGVANGICMIRKILFHTLWGNINTCLSQVWVGVGGEEGWGGGKHTFHRFRRSASTCQGDKVHFFFLCTWASHVHKKHNRLSNIGLRRRCRSDTLTVRRPSKF